MTDTTPPTDKATLEACDDKHRLSDEQRKEAVLAFIAKNYADMPQTWEEFAESLYRTCLETPVAKFDGLVMTSSQLTDFANKLMAERDEARTSLAAANKRAEEAETGMKSNFDRWTKKHYECRELRTQLAEAKDIIEELRGPEYHNALDCDWDDGSQSLAHSVQKRADVFLSRLTEANTQENKEE